MYAKTDQTNVLMLIIALIIMIVSLFAVGNVQADSIGDYREYAYTVPTSLCYDPLLGPSMIIYSPCEQGAKQEKDDTVHSVNNETTGTEAPVVENNSVVPDNDDSTPVDDTESDSKQDKKEKCNQGKGNGSEGCDPGNSNHNQVSNDEPVTNHRGNGKNNK